MENSVFQIGKKIKRTVGWHYRKSNKARKWSRGPYLILELYFSILYRFIRRVVSRLRQSFTFILNVGKTLKVLQNYLDRIKIMLKIR